ncbi:Sialin [Gryllus bimaculatus]|nr:Sialin [Gryllus bimaculatus]
MAPRWGSSVPARLVLGVMAFLMFLVTQMVRLNLNFAIVAMTDTNSTEEQRAWPEHASGVLLGAFYWSYWLTELPGGLLAQRVGGRATLAAGVLLAGALNMTLPAACRLHYLAAAAVRALQGLALGVTWPAMHCLAAHWIPKIERSKFMTSYHGASVGTALTYPLSGLVIASFGWESVFYIIGSLSCLWCIAWWLLAYNTPSDHPRISEKEKIYLEEHLGKSLSTKESSSLKTPWKNIFYSRPFWAVLVASQGLMWGSITLSMQMPTYFFAVHNLDIKTNGLVSGIPDLSKFIFGLMFSSLMDHLLKKEILSITATRKISVAVCEYLPAFLLIILAWIGTENAVVAAALLSFATAVGGASSSGSLANIVDLSPNFAGTILGLIKVLTFIPGVLSPMIVSLLQSHVEKDMVWTYVFSMLTCVYTLCCTVFLIFGSGEVQSWNEPKDLPVAELEELVSSKAKC